jgi:hypothetical protein
VSRPPAWFADQLGGIAVRVGSLEITLAEGVDLLTQAILRDPDFCYSVAAMYAGRRLRALGRDDQDAGQPTLFPDLPKVGPVLEVSVNRFKPVAAMTAADWDGALRQIETKARSAEGKEEEVRAAYERVRPLLSGDLVTADVVDQVHV